MAYSKIMFPHFGMADRKVVEFIGSWAIGATGAVGTKTCGTGMTLTRNSAGNYTVQLKGSASGGGEVSCGVPAMPFAQAVLHVADADSSNDTDSHQVDQGAKSASAGTFTFYCVDEAGVVREAPSGSVIDVRIVAQLTS